MTRVARRWVLAHPNPNRNPSLSPRADFAVEIGLLLRSGVSVFRVVEDRGEALVVEHVESLARKRLDICDLYTGLVGGDIKVVDAEAEVRALRGDVFSGDDETTLIALPPSHGSPAAARVSGEILSLIDELHACGYESLRPSRLLEIDLHRARTKLGFEGRPYGAWTVYRYDLARKRGQGAPEATVPRFSDRGGRGRSRLASIADEAIDEVIESLKENRKALIVIPDIRDDIQARLWVSLKDQAKVDALMMSDSTVSRRIHAAFPQSEIDRRNLGEREAKKRYRRTVGREPASFTLQDVEYDDKDTRTYLLSRQSGLSIGRCILTVGVDRYSEMPTGWETSEMARSTWSAKSCLLNGILPKDAKHPDFALATHHLACMGKPLRATFDNALYNHSNDMRASCADVPTICAYARPKVPTDKDSVERFNGTLERDFLRHQLGYAAKRREGAHAKGAAEAVMYKDEFIQRFVRWVCDRYQLKPGPGGLSPRQRWAEGCRMIKPRLPIDLERLTLLAFLRYHRPLRLRTEGLVFMGLPYQVDHLAELRDLLGSNAPLEFLHHPKNLMSIRVHDPVARKLFVVPIQPRYEAYAQHLLLFNHRIIFKRLREQGRRNPDLYEFLEARASHTSDTEQLRHSKKLRERRRAEQRTEEQAPLAQKPQAADIEDNTELVSDLEAHIRDLDDVELDNDDPAWTVPSLI